MPESSESSLLSLNGIIYSWNQQWLIIKIILFLTLIFLQKLLHENRIKNRTKRKWKGFRSSRAERFRSLGKVGGIEFQEERAELSQFDIIKLSNKGFLSPFLFIAKGIRVRLFSRDTVEGKCSSIQVTLYCYDAEWKTRSGNTWFGMLMIGMEKIDLDLGRSVQFLLDLSSQNVGAGFRFLGKKFCSAQMSNKRSDPKDQPFLPSTWKSSWLGWWSSAIRRKEERIRKPFLRWWGIFGSVAAHEEALEMGLLNFSLIKIIVPICSIWSLTELSNSAACSAMMSSTRRLSSTKSLDDLRTSSTTTSSSTSVSSSSGKTIGPRMIIRLIQKSSLISVKVRLKVVLDESSEVIFFN